VATKTCSNEHRVCPLSLQSRVHLIITLINEQLSIFSTVSYWWSIVTMCLSCTVMEIWCLKDNGVTTLTFWGHVTSSVKWPFNLRWATSYGWSIVTMCLSCTIMEIWCLMCHHVHKQKKEKMDGQTEKWKHYLHQRSLYSPWRR